jgi:hypothetical protein
VVISKIIVDECKLQHRKGQVGMPAYCKPPAVTIFYDAASLLQVVFEFTAAAGMAQLTECLSLDLADSLAGHIELLAHFL